MITFNPARYIIGWQEQDFDKSGEKYGKTREKGDHPGRGDVQ